jgi:nucleotide-binding universal stress UspA family protein
MKTILVPLDGSPLAEQALPEAKLLASRMDAHICLLRAVPTAAQLSMLGDAIMASYGIDEPLKRYDQREQRVWEAERERAEGYLAWHANQLRAAGLEVACEVQLGPPPDIIVESAERCHADMIVMATHGASGLRRWALGSVADKVAQTATVPLLLIRGTAEPHAAPALERIVVPLDGSELAKQALPIATELARGSGAELVLFQAISPTLDIYHGVQLPKEMVAMLCEEARAELEAHAAALRVHGVAVVVDLMVGRAAEAIVDEAVRRDAKMIVMATHGYGGLKRWALGSVADKVLHATKLPLMLVRAR